jgi:fructose-bisphosphate aldolase, class II
VPLVPTGSVVVAAAASGRAVGAFNVITLEHAEAIVAGAEQVGLPVILQVSQNAVRFHGGRLGPITAAARAVAEGADVDVSLHLDHVDDVALVRRAADEGYGSVMVDASAQDYDGNVSTTAALTAELHAQGLWVEAELGEVGGKDGAHAPGVRTDPTEARRFVVATGVDALAVAVGSSHAMTERTARLDMNLIAALRDVVPVPLVLHGSSGVPDDELRRAVTAGIVKVNIGTALNIAFTGAVRAGLEDPALVDPRRYLAPARAATADVVSAALLLLALGGQAP